MEDGETIDTGYGDIHDEGDFVRPSGSSIRYNKRYIKMIDDESCCATSTLYDKSSSSSSTLNSFRNFRDDVLRSCYVGRKIIDFYYTPFTSKVARMIKVHIPSTVPLIKKCLELTVMAYDIPINSAQEEPLLAK